MLNNNIFNNNIFDTNIFNNNIFKSVGKDCVGYPPNYSDLVQWLDFATITKDDGFTYLRDRTSNEYDALLNEAETTLTNDASYADLITADTTQQYLYNLGVAQIITIADVYYDAYDDGISYHTTFAKKVDGVITDLFTYDTARTVTQLERIYKFTNDKVLRDETGQPILDENSDTIYIK